MRTITRNVYSASELKEAHPAGFKRALANHVRMVCDDPDWAREHCKSLAAALKALGDDDPELSTTGQTMAWIENNVLAPLRAPWLPLSDPRRRSVAKYGPWYRPGLVPPCPWTGYCTDDDLLECIVQGARGGLTLRSIRANVERCAERLWGAEVEGQCEESYFLDSAEGNEREYYENGEEV